MKLHHIQWTEDRILNGYLLLMTVPVGEAVTTLPFKSERKVLQFAMPCADPRILTEVSGVPTAEYRTASFERRTGTSDEGEQMTIWVRTT